MTDYDVEHPLPFGDSLWIKLQDYEVMQSRAEAAEQKLQEINGGAYSKREQDMLDRQQYLENVVKEQAALREAAERELAELRERTRFHPYPTEKPPEHKRYLVQIKNDEVDVAPYIVLDVFVHNLADYIIGWAELPVPPEAENDYQKSVDELNEALKIRPDERWRRYNEEISTKPLKDDKFKETLESIRDLARTGVAPDSFGMTEEQWMFYKLNKIAGEADRVLKG